MWKEEQDKKKELARLNRIDWDELLDDEFLV
jgi:hypothetical protein